MRPETYLRLGWMICLIPLCSTLVDAAGRNNGNGNNKFKQKDLYKPYRYVQDWTSDTLYVGPTFVYAGGGPVRISLKFMETSVPGKLFLINTTTNETIYLMDNTWTPGVTVDVSSLTTLTAGAEVVFMYVTDMNADAPMYTGSRLPGDRYYNTLDSDDNINPALRFGRRWSVAGKVSDKILEFGFEDDDSATSDMDFNDIVFQVENLELRVYQNSARRRYYVW